MSKSIFYRHAMKLPDSIYRNDKTSKVLNFCGERGDDAKKYTSLELLELELCCESILAEFARIFPGHPEKEFYEYFRRFAMNARLDESVAIRKAHAQAQAEAQAHTQAEAEAPAEALPK